MEVRADIGVVGLAVMGHNLVLNLNDHGFTVAVYDHDPDVVANFDHEANGQEGLYSCSSYRDLLSKLKRPRKVLLMVRAGAVVDEVIARLIPHLEPGDVIIDGGNSHFADTGRRCNALAKQQILFVGTGVSGGEEGARFGPSIMPGGNKDAWPLVAPFLQAIAARTDSGEICCNWVGQEGAGHYVKMVHNGIEYGDMQLIAEAYDLLKNYVGLDHESMGQVFSDWNEGDLSSYLVEISSAILRYRDSNGTPLVELIRDSAQQKGTGKWMVNDAVNLGVPITLISEAVFARSLSLRKEEREMAATFLAGPQPTPPAEIDRVRFTAYIRDALLASKIISYTQGFMQIAAAAKANGWDVNLAEIAGMWRGGCIIRSVFLDHIRSAFSGSAELESLILDEYFRGLMEVCQNGWRKVVAAAALSGIPTPAFSSALAFYDSYRAKQLPANFIQAQRDYFGAHTYERVDRPEGEFFHTNWTGTGGDVASGSYSV